MGCSSASNVMATAKCPMTLKTLRFARNVEALGLSKKKKKSPSLANSKKRPELPSSRNLKCSNKTPSTELLQIHLSIQVTMCA